MAVKTDQICPHEKVSLSAILDRLRINFGLDSDIISVGQITWFLHACQVICAFPCLAWNIAKVTPLKIVESIDEFLHLRKPNGLRQAITVELNYIRHR